MIIHDLFISITFSIRIILIINFIKYHNYVKAIIKTPQNGEDIKRKKRVPNSEKFRLAREMGNSCVSHPIKTYHLLSSFSVPQKVICDPLPLLIPPLSPWFPYNASYILASMSKDGSYLSTI